MEKKSKKKPSGKVYIPLILVVGTVIGFGIYYYQQYLHFEKTDDAVVDCNSVALGPKIMGRISKLYAEEGDSVKAGQLLAEIDSSDLKAQWLQSQSNIAQLLSNVVSTQARLDAETENNKVLQINADKAKTDYDRAVVQKQADIITQEQFENTTKTLKTADAQLEAAAKQLSVTRAQIVSARSAVDNGKAQANVIATQLKNTRVYSPFDGVVAKRWLLPGDVVQPGQSIFTINNSKDRWVSVYIEETKLRNIYRGQPAFFSIDAFPGVEFFGKVNYIGNNTASRFSLIPPSNASGNFTKITQRVQLKVSIDSTSDGSPSQYTLLSGMSAVIKLRKK
ncbi:MAG TPA: HlyD family secretion protein [Bacteroidales bacterium]|nr:HlyD family secretion protein [Bacteroidales bacterium]